MMRKGWPDSRQLGRSDLVVDWNTDPVIIFGLRIPGTRNGYDLANNNPEAKYGKLWLLPYNTHKNPSESYPIAYTWYDGLIVSKKRIPDPG